MKIELFDIEHCEAVRELWHSVPGVGLNNVDDSREGIERYLIRNSTTSFIARENGQVAGSILADHDGRRGVIYHLTVSPNFRRRGIGSQLVKASLDALRAEHISKVALVVFARNDSGNAFWESQGFTTRPDITYRNHALVEMIRQDT